MTEQELLNKLNTVVSMAQEKILALLTDLHNEQAVAKAREIIIGGKAMEQLNRFIEATNRV